jgi:hypothetical protein
MCQAEGSSPEHSREQLISSIAKWRAVIEHANIKKQ